MIEPGTERPGGREMKSEDKEKEKKIFIIGRDYIGKE